MEAKYKLLSHAHFMPLAALWVMCLGAVNVQGQGQPDYEIGSSLLTMDVDSFLVRHIYIAPFKGDKLKTEKRIIERELSFEEGDMIAKEGLGEFLQLERNRVYNTNLFTRILFRVNEIRGHEVSVFIYVNEEFYLLPIPIFELADRNFTEWWVNQNRSFRRINYGLDLQHRNFRGRGEKIKAKIKLGFTRSITLDYDIPYINEAQTNGLRFRGEYREDRTVAYGNEGNRQIFFPADTLPKESILWKQYWASVDFQHRGGFYVLHHFRAIVNHDIVADTLLRLNPTYLANGANTQSYLSLSYQLTYDKRDIRVFPLNGTFASFLITKKGLGLINDIDLTEIRTRIGRFVPLGGRFFWSSSLESKLTLPSAHIPFVEARALGFRQFYIRGFDRLVMEGAHAVVNRNNLRFKLIDTNINFGKFMPIRQLNQIPFRLYPKLYLDWGKVWNPAIPDDQGGYYNRTLTSLGIGVDIISSYERVVRLEYALFTLPTLDQELRGLFITFDSDF